MRRLKALSIIYSICLSGCAVPLPASDVCVADPARGRLICQNLAADYYAVGNRLALRPGAAPHLRLLSRPADVDKWTCTDAQGWAGIKAWAQALQDRCQCK